MESILLAITRCLPVHDCSIDHACAPQGVALYYIIKITHPQFFEDKKHMHSMPIKIFLMPIRRNCAKR